MIGFIRKCAASTIAGACFEPRSSVTAEQAFFELTHDPDVIVSIELIQDGVCKASLGDKAHGYVWMATLLNFNIALDWLGQAARHYYPQSQFGRRHARVH